MGRSRHLKHAREAMKYARSHGFADVWVDYGRTHPILRGAINRTAVGLIFPGTPSVSSVECAKAMICRVARGGCP
jgi:hypothetical protein